MMLWNICWKGSAMKILITAFEPFGGETINPAQEVLALLPDQINGAQLIKRLVPTVFHQSVRAVCEALRQHLPDFVLMLGQAGGRAGISIERVAINIDDAGLPDNAGNQPVDQAIEPSGPAAWFVTLPIKKMAGAIRDAGLPVNISNSAGTFVCNHLLYGVLHHIAQNSLPVRAGFLHLPYLPQQAGKKEPPAPCMELKVQLLGLEAALSVLAGLQSQQ